MRILILGIDGYLGWPAALHLSSRGHEVSGVDNLMRRGWDTELGTASLLPIADPERRVSRWHRYSGRTIRWFDGDMCDAGFVSKVIDQTEPHAVVHFAEQRSAPYSMISREHAVFTQSNNVVGTLNLLFALRGSHTHLIKLGTMGEYGTPNIDIEEGWLDVTHNGRTDRMLFPKEPGSFYHLSKVHDSHNIEFACRAWGLAATDLNQGVVYGCNTEETKAHPELATRFDYDGVFGTVLNRFCVQAALGLPLSIHGSGRQTRGFLDIRDTCRCIELAAVNPAAPGEFRVFNQFTEQFSILELAERVREARAAHGLQTSFESIANPRVEADSHHYHAKHQTLLTLGLRPHPLSKTLVDDIVLAAERNRDSVRVETLPTSVDWNEGASGWVAKRNGNGSSRAKHHIDPAESRQVE